MAWLLRPPDGWTTWRFLLLQPNTALHYIHIKVCQTKDFTNIQFHFKEANKWIIEKRWSACVASLTPTFPLSEVFWETLFSMTWGDDYVERCHIYKLQRCMFKRQSCTVIICTLVLLWFVLICSKDLDGGETSHAILTTQWLVLVCIYGTNLDNSLKICTTNRLTFAVWTFNYSKI